MSIDLPIAGPRRSPAATDVAVQRDVVQFPLCRLRFTRVFLRLVAHFAQIRLAEQRVAVNAQLAVEANQIACTVITSGLISISAGRAPGKWLPRPIAKIFGELLRSLPSEW